MALTSRLLNRQAHNRIPAGALIPQAVGNDINCGMRVEVTSLHVERLRPHLDMLERRLRHLFFEGGRRIGLTAAHREGLLRDGLPGLLAGGIPTPADGVWRHVGPDVGSVGGGNHFAELQYVAARDAGTGTLLRISGNDPVRNARLSAYGFNWISDTRGYVQSRQYVRRSCGSR